MRTLASLNEEFIERANRSVLRGAPVTVKARRDLPVLPTDRWAQRKTDDESSMEKTFKFMSHDARDRFVSSLLEFEQHTNHRAKIVLDELEITIVIKTRHVNIITELDKEYARFCDTLHKDVVYDRLHGRATDAWPDVDEP